MAPTEKPRKRSVETPARWPLSTLTFLIQSLSVLAEQPIIAVIDTMAC
ncbi:hypothetical protein [Paracoccus yeei]